VLVAGDGGAVHGTLLRDGVRKDAPDRRQHGRGNRPLARHAEFGDLARKLSAAIEPQTEFLQQISRQVRVVRALDPPAVSYTHLDVYKRQHRDRAGG